VRYGNFFDVYTSSIRPLYEARNDCVRTFLKSDASYLFFVDSDAVPPANAIEQLLSHGFEKKIVGGLCHEIKQDNDRVLKKIPLVLEAINKSEYKIMDVILKGLIAVDATGTVCVMIHRSVFLKMKEPWFFNQAEDFYFYEEAKKAGSPVYVDCNCKVTHYCEVGI
jgi:GT2 family glycosyltransferase